MFNKYVLSALGRLAVGPALPLSPSNHTTIPWLHPHTRPSRAQTYTIFNDDTLNGRNRPPLPIKSKFLPKNTELSFATAQAEDSTKGNA